MKLRGAIWWRPGAPASADDKHLVGDIRAISDLRRIKIEGIYTHFAAADSADKSYSDDQLAIFESLLEQIRASGVEFGCRHAANSAATIELPETHLDMVRPGVSQYGLWPSDIR